jgi:hypothetical protein
MLKCNGRKGARIAMTLPILMLVAGVTMSVPASAQEMTQMCGGIQIKLNSLQRVGLGDVAANFELLNTNNDDMAMFAYYGGANGHNTFLVDDSGTEWPKKRADGNGNHRQPLIAGVKTKYNLVFHLSAGGQDARVFQVILEAQLLPLTGMVPSSRQFGWCKYQFRNVSLGN